MNRQYNYKNNNFTSAENFVNKNSIQKSKTSAHGTLKQSYGADDNQSNTIIYPKQDRVCPKKGNSFFFLGVS